MRIVHVADEYQPQIGYQEPALTACQQRAGHTVAVVTGARYGSVVKELRRSNQAAAGRSLEHGIPVQRLPILFEMPGAARRPWLNGLEATLRDLQPEAIHLHNFTSFTAWRVARLKPHLGCRLVVDNHQCLENIRLPETPRSRAMLRDLFYLAFRVSGARAVAAQADALVAVGESERAFAAAYLGWPITRVGLVRLGADPVRFAPDAALRARQRAAWGLADTDLVLLFAGQFRPLRRLETLIEAAARLRQAGVPVQVRLVGAGYEAYQTRLRAQAAAALPGGCTFLPHAAPAELNAYFNAADIGVWPKSYSLTFIEALAAGLPVVAEASDYNRHTLADGARYFEPDQLPALVACVRELAARPELRQAVGQAGRRRVLDALNWDTINAQFMALYQGGGPDPAER